jgi:hypothetical protein
MVIGFNLETVYFSISSIFFLKAQVFLFGQANFLRKHSFRCRGPWNIPIKSNNLMFLAGVASKNPPPLPL